MDGTLIPVFEIMEVTPAIRNMIRENKVHQIDGLIYSSTGSGMSIYGPVIDQIYIKKDRSAKKLRFYMHPIQK